MKMLIRSAVAGMLLASVAFGAVSPQEAARLGQDLTPLGGEKAGNADGTIPAWTGGIKSAADAGFPNYRSGDHIPTHTRATSRCSPSRRRTSASTPPN
ncbi:MAG TPA: hypothetical protein VM713_00215 [Steroidobacteraceae bacterium]|nr:hypothetical protein [Steroidobacteraceae bacterium]